jgi:hypothetical protein
MLGKRWVLIIGISISHGDLNDPLNTDLLMLGLYLYPICFTKGGQFFRVASTASLLAWFCSYVATHLITAAFVCAFSSFVSSFAWHSAWTSSLEQHFSLSFSTTRDAGLHS